VRRFAQDDDSVGEPIKNILNKLAFTGLRPELAGPIRESFLFGGRGTPGFRPMKTVHFDLQIVFRAYFRAALALRPFLEPFLTRFRSAALTAFRRAAFLRRAISSGEYMVLRQLRAPQ
jgi:hypothetical protein